MDYGGVWQQMGKALATSLAVLLVVGCSANEYTSLDLSQLPCELNLDEQYFYPVEFTKRGELRYESQKDHLVERFQSSKSPISDIVIFIHGWNKNPSSAETNYQDFLCRIKQSFDKHGSDHLSSTTLAIGVFWPSTVSGKLREPLYLKPYSYFQIRKRADLIATVGLQTLLTQAIQLLHESTADNLGIHLIGHSMGARMLATAFGAMGENRIKMSFPIEHSWALGDTELNISAKVTVNTTALVEFLYSAARVNLVLINAALADNRFDWLDPTVHNREINTEFKSLFLQGSPWEIDQVPFSANLFNVHSRNDRANSVLFPIASVFNDDPVACAIGSCGISRLETLCVSEEGSVEEVDGGSKPWRDPGIEMPIFSNIKMPLPGIEQKRGLGAVNVDASLIVSSHSDIYKGRVADMIGFLLNRYDEELSPNWYSTSDACALN